LYWIGAFLYRDRAAISEEYFVGFWQHLMLWVDSMWLDFRFALRQLINAPAFTAAAVGMLALGIGVNATVFTVTNAVLFKGFRLVQGNDRILYIHDEKNGQYSGVSYPDFQDWQSQARSFDGMGAVADLRITLNDQSDFPERYTATRITTNAFHLLGREPFMGRDFAPSDAIAGAPAVAILSYGFWERRFGKDPQIIGRTLENDGGSRSIVIGVMPKNFSFPQNQDLWIPLLTEDLQRRDARNLWFAFGRLRDGVSVESARAELATIGNRLATVYPQSNEGQVLRPHTFAEFFIGPQAITTYGMLWGAVGFVLLIACVNLANLMLARVIARSREISQRIALGASRWRIIRQLLIESLLLSTIGGFLGWWIARIGVDSYVLATNPAVGEWRRDLLDYTMDYRVLTYLTAISIGTGLLFGFAPALRCSRLDLNAVLKNAGIGAIGMRGRTPPYRFLLAAEVALAIVLLAGAGAMIRSFLNIYNADVGASIANIRTMFLHLPEVKYPNRETQISFFDDLKARLETVPGVESASIGNPPASGVPRPRPYQLQGDVAVDEQSRPAAVTQTIGPDYFRTLGAAVSGREFNQFDGASGVPVVVVNRRFADKHWPGQNALGQRLRLFDRGTPQVWRTVVGVVSNIIYDPSRQEITPVIYMPYAQMPGEADMWVLVRTPLRANELVTAFRHVVSALDPDVPVWLGPYNLAERLAAGQLYGTVRNHAILLLIFAGVALVLASFGLYAVIANSLSQRTREIGIRIAVGATTRDILKLVLNVAMFPVVIGLITGLAGLFAVNRVLSSEFVRVSPADPPSFLIACAALVVSAMLACWIPARRAMRLDPVAALRRE
jgi:predicted permease